MPLSLTPLLFVAELGFVLALARRGQNRDGVNHLLSPVLWYLVWLAVYGTATGVLGAKGVYVDERLLPTMPGLWLQVVSVIAIAGPVVVIAPLRHALRQVFDATPLHWFAYFQALRISALGTAYKTAIGEFPLFFEILIGVPDLLFGLSALWVAHALKSKRMGPRGFMVWNLIGALVIVPAAPLLLQLGMPGPLQVFGGLPDTRAIFTYPMSLAPMIVVPFFVLLNVGVAWRLWERRRAHFAASSGRPLISVGNLRR